MVLFTFLFTFSGPPNSSFSGCSSRNLLNPPATSDFYALRRMSSGETLLYETNMGMAAAAAPGVNPNLVGMGAAPPPALNVIPLINRATMVEASKRAFLQVK